MANSYTDGYGFISIKEIPEINKVLKAWQVLDSRDFTEVCLPFNVDEPGGLIVECWRGAGCGVNGLYFGSRDGWLNVQLFHRFFALMLKNGWITADYVSIEGAGWCDKPRPGEFGGFYLRVTPDGELLDFGTGTLDALTNDQLRQIQIYVRDPHRLPTPAYALFS